MGGGGEGEVRWYRRVVLRILFLLFPLFLRPPPLTSHPPLMTPITVLALRLLFLLFRLLLRPLLSLTLLLTAMNNKCAAIRVQVSSQRPYRANTFLSCVMLSKDTSAKQIVAKPNAVHELEPMCTFTVTCTLTVCCTLAASLAAFFAAFAASLLFFNACFCSFATLSLATWPKNTNTKQH